MIEVERLCFSYHKGSPIFLDFNCSIAKGERYSVIGPSGCGKTTLLHLLAGLCLPASGNIGIDGLQLTGPRISTGLILQDYGLLPWANAFDNISVGLKIRGFDRKSTDQITGEWLRELGIEDVSSHYPAQLSGGQRQRVAIARTLALEPDLLLMDEPFASLDTLTREEMQNLILSLRQDIPTARDTPTTIVLVTHNIEEAVFLGEKIMILSHSPIMSPTIIENSGSGYSEYRKTSDFNERCWQLRELIGQSANGRQLAKTSSAQNEP